MTLTAPTQWRAEELWQTLEPSLPGLTIEILPTIGSTNTELMRRARTGDTAPTLLVAESQTAGRGRLGREWRSAPGASLTFSLGLLLAPADWSGLSLAVGVALAEALHPEVGLKWPNDLWLCNAAGDRKLGGILIETATAAGALPSAPRYTVVGVGLNIAAPPADASDAPTDIPPDGLLALLPHADAPAVLSQVLPPLLAAIQQFALCGFAPFAARFAVRDVLCGREVHLRPAPGTLHAAAHGTAAGVAPDGALLLHTARGLQTVTSADFSVRPARPARLV